MAFSKEHHRFRRLLRGFVQEEITPNVDEWEEREEIPRKFYRRLRPPRLLWGPVAVEASEVEPSLGYETLGQALLCAVFVFTGMFGLGKLLLGATGLGLVLMACSAVSCFVLLRWAVFTNDA